MRSSLVPHILQAFLHHVFLDWVNEYRQNHGEWGEHEGESTMVSPRSLDYYPSLNSVYIVFDDTP
jgi:hypothetical protein